MSRRLARRGGLLVLALLLTAIVPSGASARPRDAGHCIFPDGTDLNEVWGVKEPIVWFLCDQISVGKRWRVAEGWGMNATFEFLPEGFTPAGATPTEDFLAKFEGLKVVVDPGTRHERRYTFTNVEDLLVGDGIVNGVTMGILAPLPAGTHMVESYWSMRALHCDGFPEAEGGCLAAGDSLAFETTFEVTKPKHH